MIVPKCILFEPLLAPSEPRGRAIRAKWRPKRFHTMCLGGTHPNHAIGPLNGPLRHSLVPQKGSFWPLLEVLGGPLGARFGPDYHQYARLGWTHGYNTLWPDIGPLLGPKRPVLAQNAPFGGLECPWRAPGNQPWSQLALIGPPRLDSWSPHTLPWYRASPGPPWGRL